MNLDFKERKTQLIVGSIVLGLGVFIYIKKKANKELANRQRELSWNSKMVELTKAEQN
jgi:hypothetical protein